MNFYELRFAASVAAFIALPNLGHADEAMKCVQLQLNELGYDAGVPDGQIGKRTKSAGLKYIEYMKANNPGWNMPPIEVSNARLWCEKVAEAWPEVSDNWVALKYNSMKTPETENSGAILAESVTSDFIINVAIDKGANFGVTVLKADKVIWQSEDFGRDKESWAVPVPKSALAEADQVCFALEPGWVVLDQAGNPFQVSCQPITDQVRPMLTDGTEFTYSMAIQKAAS